CVDGGLGGAEQRALEGWRDWRRGGRRRGHAHQSRRVQVYDTDPGARLIRTTPRVPAMADDPSFFEVVTTTRAIRRYRPDPVPDEDLARILFAASRAPSGSIRQPFRFPALRDGPRARAARRVLGESFRELWAAKRAADG